MVLVIEMAVLMPVGWLACLVGTRRGRHLSLACAAGMVAVAVIYGVASYRYLNPAPYGQNPDPGLGGLAYGVVMSLVFCGLPALLLWWGAHRMAKMKAAEEAGLLPVADDGRGPADAR